MNHTQYVHKGGIEKYLQTYQEEGGGYWQGKNFTFDKREAFDVKHPQGVGGVLKKQDMLEGKDKDSKNKKRKRKSDLEDEDEVIISM